MSWKSVLLFLLNFLAFFSAKKNNPRFLVAVLQLEMKILPTLLHQKLPSKTSWTCHCTSLQRGPENTILQQKLKLEFNVRILQWVAWHTYVLSLPRDLLETFQLIKHRVWSPASIKMMVAVWAYNTQNSCPFISFDKDRMINVFINTVLPWFFNIYKARR